jgi:hypothetical protein
LTEGARDGGRKEIEVMVQVNAPTCAIATAPLSSPTAATTQIEALEVRPRGCRV